MGTQLLQGVSWPTQGCGLKDRQHPLPSEPRELPQILLGAQGLEYFSGQLDIQLALALKLLSEIKPVDFHAGLPVGGDWD